MSKTDMTPTAWSRQTRKAACRMGIGGATALALPRVWRAFLILLFICSATLAPAQSQSRVNVLLERLGIAQVIEIMRVEGLRSEDELNAEFLGGQGGAHWAGELDRIYDGARMMDTVRTALETGLTPDQLERAIAFFGSDLGIKIVELELAARSAMLDETLEDAMRRQVRGPDATLSETLENAQNFIAANDLVERNVSGTLGSHYAFFRGLSEGATTSMSDQEILAHIQSQESEIRDDVEEWLTAFFVLAHGPLDQAERQAYLDFNLSEEGKALNLAFFAGFDKALADISYAIGKALALELHSQDL